MSPDTTSNSLLLLAAGVAAIAASGAVRMPLLSFSQQSLVPRRVRCGPRKRTGCRRYWTAVSEGQGR